MPPAVPSGAARPADGVDARRAARERNREAVVDALLDLYGEGRLNPSADEVAERSGLSRRSLFRYFDSLDDLCRAAIERQHRRAAPLAELKDIGKGPLASRIQRLVAQRAALFDAIAPAARVGRLRAPYQPTVAEEIHKSRVLFRRQIERHFEPELRGLHPERRQETLAALDVLCSFESFEFLRTVQGLTLAQYQTTLRHAVTAIMEAAAGQT